MIIIIAADNDIDTDLDDLAETYDRAKSPSEREQIAEETFTLIGGRIKAMIKRVGRGWARTTWRVLPMKPSSKRLRIPARRESSDQTDSAKSSWPFLFLPHFQ